MDWGRRDERATERPFTNWYKGTKWGRNEGEEGERAFPLKIHDSSFTMALLPEKQQGHYLFTIRTAVPPPPLHSFLPQIRCCLLEFGRFHATDWTGRQGKRTKLLRNATPKQARKAARRDACRSASAKTRPEQGWILLNSLFNDNCNFIWHDMS